MTLKPEHIVEALNKKTFDEIDPDEVLKHYGYKPEEVRCNGVGIGVWRKEEAFQKLGDIGAYAKSIQAFGFSIGSDYGPCKMLADAAAEAGIDRANFPFKTTMFFTEKEGVLVRDGYGAPAVRIC